ncbi:MAG: pantetheine-phosphate adenylyltransferase [Bacteroidaceae bacterium]|nr:pantetheine-phosphate adenylyltransferase [Bacteroidaceae bacterium]
MKKAIFPGTFDPFTLGHLSIVNRSLSFMDEIVISVGVNSKKKSYFTLEQREKMLKKLFADNPKVTVQSYDCLTTDFAEEIGARFIIRGIRTVSDFEYEETIADVNRQLTGIETILLFTEPEFTCISSTIVRELLSFGKDVSRFVPAGIDFNL